MLSRHDDDVGRAVDKCWWGSWSRDPRQAQFLTTAEVDDRLNRADTALGPRRHRVRRGSSSPPSTSSPAHGVPLAKASRSRPPRAVHRWRSAAGSISATRTSNRCHEGTPRFGDKVVLQYMIINTDLDIELGDRRRWPTGVDLRDFDHRMDSIEPADQVLRASSRAFCADRTRHLDRRPGDDLLRHDGRTWPRAGSDAGGQVDSVLLHRRRCAGEGGQQPQAVVGDVRPPSVLSSPPRWPISSARRLSR